MKRIVIALIAALILTAPIMAETGVSVAVPFQFAKSPTVFYEAGVYQYLFTLSFGKVYAIGQGYYGEALGDPSYQFGAEGNAALVFEGSPYQTIAAALLLGSGYNWSKPTDFETYTKNSIGGGVQFRPYPEWRLLIFGRMIQGFSRSPAFDLKLVFMAKIL